MESSLVRRESGTLSFTPEQEQLIKDTVCKGGTSDELKLFLYVCTKSGLDPFSRQIYSIPRKVKNDQGAYVNVRSIQTGIDGFRTVSERSFARGGSSKYGGEIDPVYCGEDGVWQEIWLKPESPLAAKAGVVKFLETSKGESIREVVYKTVYWDSVCQKYNGVPSARWQGKSGVHQLGKCALAAAHRAAFPQDLSGIYLNEEMQRDEIPGSEEKIKTNQAIEDFEASLPTETIERLAALGYNTKAMRKSLCEEAGNTLEGLALQLEALNLMADFDAKLRDQIHFAGYKNKAEVRRLVIKCGNDMTKLNTYLSGGVIDAEVVK